MITGLKINIEGEDYIFTESGSVVLSSTNSSVGRWSSGIAGRRVNEFVYDLNGVLQPAIKTRYGFNDRNQLVVNVLKDARISADASYVFPGAIEVDDENDVVYKLLDRSGRKTERSIVVFGSLRFASPLELVVDLIEGGETVIRASNTAEPIKLTTARGVSKGQDRLLFMAMTINTLENEHGTFSVNHDARIGFDGMWQMGSEGLHFLATGDVGDDGQALTLKIDGRYKAVSAGLEVAWSNDTGVTGTLLIKGEHEFEEATSSWRLKLGVTQNQDSQLGIEAEVDGKITHKTKGGNEFVIAGKLKAKSASGRALSLELALDVAYQFKENRITFNAVAQSAGGRTSYELKLGGEIRIGPGMLKFAIRYSSDNTVEFDVEYDGNDKSFLDFFKLKLKRDKNGRVEIQASFRIECTWVNGAWRVGPPQKLA